MVRGYLAIFYLDQVFIYYFIAIRNMNAEKWRDCFKRNQGYDWKKKLWDKCKLEDFIVDLTGVASPLILCHLYVKFDRLCNRHQSPFWCEICKF